MVTVVGIILATALIMAVACMAVSFRASLIAYEKQENGDWHYRFLEVQPENLKYFENNRNIRRVGLAAGQGYALLPGSINPDKPYLYLCAVDDTAMEMLSLRLTEGRMPENNSEIVISSHIRSNAQVDIEVGDTLSLGLGERMADGYPLNQDNPYSYEQEELEVVEEKVYTVVGIIRRPNYVVEQRMAPGYSVFTRLDDAEVEKQMDVYTSYTDWGLKHAKQVTAGLLGVPEELYEQYYISASDYDEADMERITRIAGEVNENYWLLKWVRLSFSANTLNMLYGMSALAVLIIIVTSVSCIKNSFMISLTEKLRLYGRLACVGVTARQQRKIVYYEALFLGMAGIPAGIASGILAAAVLVAAVGGVVEDAIGIRLVFGVSLPAVCLAVILAAVTIFFSSVHSARMAAKTPPISAIRANNMVKGGRQRLKCPNLIHRLFGIAGEIAYKNLKRAKAKYRTTVRSIAASVAVFIGVSAFVQLASYASDYYFESMEYQLRASIKGENARQEALAVSQFEDVEFAEVVRSGLLVVDSGTIDYTDEWQAAFEDINEDKDRIRIYALGEEGYAQYCRTVGVTVEEAQDKAIIIALFEYTCRDDSGKMYEYTGVTANYQRGDVIANSQGNVELEVLTQTDKMPMFLQNRVKYAVTAIVSDAWWDTHVPDITADYVDVYVKCQDADAVEAQIRDMQPISYTVTNYDAEYRANRAMYLVEAVFLFGFIAVVSLIGITNIFNTITTNMELRAPEFAMLKAVGMTKGEFQRMFWLEGLFYGGKALAIGIPLGILTAYGFHRALGAGIVTSFRPPIAGICISALCVFLLLYLIMRYSMGKFNRKNIVETIQNENI